MYTNDNPPPPAGSPPPPAPAAPPAPYGTRNVNAVFLCTDTETGGIDQRLCPVLSVAALIADAQMQRIDGISFKILPPQDTWLQVPIREKMFLEEKDWKPKIDSFINVYTGEIVPAGEFVDQANRFQIQAGAAEVNGFIQKGADGKWDLESYKAWMAESIPQEAADQALANYVGAASAHKLTGVAHNARFDEKFIAFHLPRFRMCFAQPSEAVLAALGLDKLGTGLMRVYADTGYICTWELIKAWYKLRGEKGRGGKLGDLSALANYVNPNAHDAFADTEAVLAGLSWLSKQPEWSLAQG